MGFTVCFLLDKSVISRFWCCLEYFLATRSVGNSSINADEKRLQVLPMGAAAVQSEVRDQLQFMMKKSMGDSLETCIEYLSLEDKLEGKTMPLAHKPLRARSVQKVRCFPHAMFSFGAVFSKGIGAITYSFRNTSLCNISKPQELNVGQRATHRNTRKYSEHRTSNLINQELNN